MNRPAVVSADEWRAARAELLIKEKKLTRALDDLAAQRRRLPMMRLDGEYTFTAPDGRTVGLTDVFDGKRQLVIYHFMLSPGSDRICGGCSSFTDNLSPDSHIHARDTRLILMCPAPQDEIDVLRKRFGWQVPWFSSDTPAFYDDLGIGGGFALSVLLRDGDEVFRTYLTDGRGVDRLRLDMNLLDLTPYGRQEVWEDSPEGWPQTPTMQWIKLRDEYPSR